VLAEARARGVLVIAPDTGTVPRDAADATIATDDVEAGARAGRALRAASADPGAPVLMRDGAPGSTVSEQRHAGFLAGSGLAASPALLAAVPTAADVDPARAAMADLLARHPGVRGVYAINEPVADGAREALPARGRADAVKVVTIDGGCLGVPGVRSGRLSADVMQFPTAMAQRGVDAAMAWVDHRRRPPAVLDTGSAVIAGPELVRTTGASDGTWRDPTWGLLNCWG
jgi:fructose transport system substrate-binding protein